MLTNVKKRIKKEWAMRANIRSGFSRKAASQWYYRERRDLRLWQDVYSESVLKEVHKRGFLAKNIERLHLLENPNCDRISDRDYFYLQPMNNSFSKWIEDMNTMSRMFPQHNQRFLKIYYSLIRRGKTMVLQYPRAKKHCSADDIIALIRSDKKKLLIRPAYWDSNEKWYNLDYCDDRHIFVNDQRMLDKDFSALVQKLMANYVVCDRPDYSYPIFDGWKQRAFLKFYIANDYDADSKILCALAETIESGDSGQQYPIDVQTGSFSFNGQTVTINRWETVKHDLLELTSDMKQLSFFSISIVLCDDGFKVTNCNAFPYLPRVEESSELNEYLKWRLSLKKKVPVTFKYRIKAIKDSFFKKFVIRYCKPGIRPYMEQLWIDSVKSDLKYRGTSLRQKIWAWKRGFLSYRIQQYNLTEENYADILSDYQYHWLNRINNLYQKWINDKTSFRAVMDPFKKYIPDYYFSVYKEHGKVCVIPMQDCPEGVPSDYTGVCQLLREQGKLVFKPSAGTHGDGFYCLAYENGVYFINGEETTEQGIDELLKAQKSFYIVTSYINMHPELKKIYPQSVNSIRIMVINRYGYNPKIMQTYMRIGSSKTGFTDNVGYGGICAMINMETGELYDPETLRDHVYYPCPKHPDTGTEIAGIVVPHWDLIRKEVVEICRSMPELEYLGFDVAVMEDTFNVMEINIHQDLHKVAKHSKEIKEFYAAKIRYKEMLNSK